MISQIIPAMWQIILQKVDLEDSLKWMADHGQSVILNYGEDTEHWECSWITGGVRHSGFSRSPREAVIQAVEKAKDAMVKGESQCWKDRPM